MNRRVGLAVCALGVMAAMTQLALMREMLCVFSGNELALGVILGNGRYYAPRLGVPTTTKTYGLPKLLLQSKTLTIGWIDFYR